MEGRDSMTQQTTLPVFASRLIRGYHPGRRPKNTDIGKKVNKPSKKTAILIMALCRCGCGFAASASGIKRQFCGNKISYSFSLTGPGGEIFSKKS
ncbi:MAG: hypothetical protein LBC55_09480, partial [Desulfovibrio sp.]|nr:hypothetical protein [Desulfovibrio sp.]